MKSMEIDLFYGSWTSIISLKRITIWSLLSNMILIFLIIHNIIYVLIAMKVFFQYYRHRSKKKYSEEHWQTYEKENPSLIYLFKQNLRKETKYGIFIYVSYSIRDILLPFFLIYFINYPVIQIISSFFLHLEVLIVLIGTRPYKSLVDTILEIINISAFLFISLAFSLIYLTSDNLSDS